MQTTGPPISQFSIVFQLKFRDLHSCDCYQWLFNGSVCMMVLWLLFNFLINLTERERPQLVAAVVVDFDNIVAVDMVYIAAAAVAAAVVAAVVAAAVELWRSKTEIS